MTCYYLYVWIVERFANKTYRCYAPPPPQLTLVTHPTARSFSFWYMYFRKSDTIVWGCALTLPHTHTHTYTIKLCNVGPYNQPYYGIIFLYSFLKIKPRQYVTWRLKCLSELYVQCLSARGDFCMMPSHIHTPYAVLTIPACIHTRIQ